MKKAQRNEGYRLTIGMGPKDRTTPIAIASHKLMPDDIGALREALIDIVIAAASVEEIGFRIELLAVEKAREDDGAWVSKESLVELVGSAPRDIALLVEYFADISKEAQ